MSLTTPPTPSPETDDNDGASRGARGAAAASIAADSVRGRDVHAPGGNGAGASAGIPVSPPSARPRRTPSLAAKLTAWYALSTVLLLSVTAALLYVGLDQSLAYEDDRFLAHLISEVSELLEKHPDDSPEVRWEIESDWRAGDFTRVYVRLLDDAGRTISQTPGMAEVIPATSFPPPTSEPSFRDGRDVRSPAEGGPPFRVLAGRARSVTGEGRVVQVALDETVERTHRMRYLRRAGIVLGVAAIASAAAGYALARKSIRPVRKIIGAAHQIRASTLHERIATAGLPAELADLAGTFNEMLDRLEEAFDRLSRFSADIAHELRTPVNNLRGEAEVALSRARTPEDYRVTLESSLEETDRLRRMIEGLLFLARADDPQTQVKRERIDVRSALEKTVEFYEPAASERGVTLRIEAAAGIEASLDASLVRHALSNLLDNALAHTPRGGAVTLRAARAGDSAVRIEVADTGCGIAAADLPHVFDRFYRCDRSRSTAAGTGGAGLGLSIVSGIARLHGGTADIASGPGRGTVVTLSFPAVPTA